MEALCVIGTDGEVRSSGEAGALPWWSFTKTVLAIAALKLVDAGRRVLGRTGEGPGGTTAVYGVDGADGPVVVGAWSWREPASSVESRAIEALTSINAL